MLFMTSGQQPVNRCSDSTTQQTHVCTCLPSSVLPLQVALDFVTPEAVGECMVLRDEFRRAPAATC